MTDLTWANHPSAELRVRLADYLGRGWAIDELRPDSALLTRPKAWTKPGRLLINPFYVFYAGRKLRDDRIRLTLASNDDVLETRS